MISQSLPESARQRAGLFKEPGADAQMILIKSPGPRLNTIEEYFRTHTHKQFMS